MDVTFKDVVYVVKDRADGSEKRLLDGVSGYFRKGQLCALMGPSGCGKTTLLDLLAGRKNAGTASGEVLYGGSPPTPALMKSKTGYVEQFDTLVPNLTVEEMLYYSADLKRPVAEGRAQKRAVVDAVITQLRLDNCRAVPIGDALTKGISGGQAKRVNIGLVLVSEPDVIYMDEPTTGLDSFMANEVVSVIRELADSSGKAVCCTIHSPTSYAFSLFDEMLMLKAGKTIFFGELCQQGRLVRKYFEAQGYEFPVGRGAYSLPEWLMDVISGGYALTSLTFSSGQPPHHSAPPATASAALSAPPSGAMGMPTAASMASLAEEDESSAHDGAGAEEPAAAKTDQQDGKGVGTKGRAASEGLAPPRPPAVTLSQAARGEAPPGEDFASVYAASELRARREAELDDLVASLRAARAGAAEAAAPTGAGRASSMDIEAGGPTPASGPDSAKAGPEGPEPAAGDQGFSRQLTALSARANVTVPSWYAVWTLFYWRGSRNFTSAAYLAPRIGDKLLFALVVMSLFWNTGRDARTDTVAASATAGVLFMVCALNGFGAASYVPTLVLDRPLFYRERADGMYRVPAYLTFLLGSEAILLLVTSTMYTLITYWAIGLQASFAVYWVVFYLTGIIGILAAYLAAAISPTLEMANALLPVYMVINLFFAGFLVPFATMPRYWYWYSFIDFLRWAWGSLMISEFKDSDLEFFGGQTILQFYSLEGYSEWAYIGYLCIFPFVYLLLVWLAVTFIRHSSR